MPHDAHGKALKVGDLVLVPAMVTRIDQGVDYCNMEFETTMAMYPGDSKMRMALNTKQVHKAEWERIGNDLLIGSERLVECLRIARGATA